MAKAIPTASSSSLSKRSPRHNVEGAHGKLTPEEALRLIAQAKSLGLSVARFEQRCGFRKGRLYAWVKLFRKHPQRRKPIKRSPPFVELQLNSADMPAAVSAPSLATQSGPLASIRLIVNSVTIEVPAEFSKDNLRAILQVLEARS